MNTHAKLTLLFSITGLVAGCGGGGDSGTANPPATTTGTFVDSATQGIAYTCGATTGVTDAMGTFNFVAGDSCTFKVGGITLGTAAGKPLLSPVDLVAGATSETDPVVTNLAQFLISLDNDNNPANGIVIDTAVQTALTGKTLDFTQAPAAFATAAQALVGAAITGRTLVSIAAAQTHLGATLVGRFSGPYTCTYSGVATNTNGGSVALNGTAAVSITNGVVTGSSQLTATPPPPAGSVNGTVSSSGSGTLNLAASGTASGASWSGAFYTDGTGKGAWSSPVNANGTSAKGDWSCKKA